MVNGQWSMANRECYRLPVAGFRALNVNISANTQPVIDLSLLATGIR
jgi:hypothetical protein